MPTCFVIQPFDQGKYDKRYKDIFEPAIKAAGFEPYRVDRDPKASIPIDEVQRQIGDSDVCFAEITENNPNVWFELGYAIASKKEICLVCSSERTSRYPFDIQHRLIHSYNTESTSDYEEARESIRIRLEAIRDKATALDNIKQNVVLKPQDGLTHHEISCLCVIMQNRHDPSHNVANWRIVNDMEKLGYNKLAAQLALQKLLKKNLVYTEIEEGFDQEIQEEYKITKFQMTDTGLDFLMENEAHLELILADSPKAIG